VPGQRAAGAVAYHQARKLSFILSFSKCATKASTAPLAFKKDLAPHTSGHLAFAPPVPWPSIRQVAANAPREPPCCRLRHCKSAPQTALAIAW